MSAEELRFPKTDIGDIVSKELERTARYLRLIAAPVRENQAGRPKGAKNKRRSRRS